MDKDPSQIPPGEYCYRIRPIQSGEIMSRQRHRYGKDLREYPNGPDTKAILCPYWERTDYGTVRCNYLNEEYLDIFDFDAYEKLQKHFDDERAHVRFPHSWTLADEIKICDICSEEDNDWIFPA